MLDHHKDQGRSVIAMAYRGGGGVPGTPSEATLKADALAAFDGGLARLSDAPGIVLVQGYSLGTGLAVHVANRRAVDGVILTAPYQRLCRLMAKAAYLPACLLPGIQDWPSDKDASGIKAATIILHGSDDTLIPIAEGRRLFADFTSAPDGAIRFVEIEGGGHNDLLSFPNYLEEIERFIASVDGQT